jgi:hypothetical protein
MGGSKKCKQKSMSPSTAYAAPENGEEPCNKVRAKERCNKVRAKERTYHFQKGDKSKQLKQNLIVAIAD